jgi:hypothetical protein
LIIVHHAGAVEGARSIYQAIVRTGNVDLTVIVPKRIGVDRVYAPSGWLIVAEEMTRDGYRMVPIPLGARSRAALDSRLGVVFPLIPSEVTRKGVADYASGKQSQ